jgi:hypothetical protein
MEAGPAHHPAPGDAQLALGRRGRELEAWVVRVGDGDLQAPLLAAQTPALALIRFPLHPR